MISMLKVREGIGLLKTSPSLAFELSRNGDELERKQIALAIINVTSGEILEKRIWVREEDIRRASIIGTVPVVNDSDDGLSVSVRWWNSFNSAYEILGHPELIVIANKYLVERKYLPEQYVALLGDKANNSKYTDMVYVPFSENLLSEEIIDAGRNYLDEKTDAAFAELAKSQVHSRAHPEMLVSDFISRRLVKNIVLVEHVDPSWLALSDDGGKMLANRVLVIIGSNQEWSYRYTSSPAGANGIAQFIESTYDAMVDEYPEANLIKDYKLGMANHTNALKAAALLFDTNTKILEERIDSEKIKENPVSNEMLSAAYNGGTDRVIRAVNRYGQHWAQSDIFPSETTNYVKKYELISKLEIF